MKLLTRSQLIKGQVSHQDYYLHVAERSGITASVFNGRMKRMIANSTDENLNDVPLKLWDSLANSISIYELNDTGEKSVSLSAKVCALKALARSYKESGKLL
jgi:hypothetical protein|tara:strand:+ start:2806 stop:3111 length:306 start_codon:yes stop_codon:yes gene_type:complete